MLKIIISLMLLIISLYGDNFFTDKDMKKYSELILNNKQKVYTPSELVKTLFKIKQRDEFETKVKYQERISNLTGNGVYFVFKELHTKYDIDNNELEFMNIETGTFGSVISKMLYAEETIKKKGFSQVDYRLNNKLDEPFPLKNKLINDKERFGFGKNGFYSAFLKMSSEVAKKLKNNNKNIFYQIIAIRIDAISIQNRKIEDISYRYNGTMLYRLAYEVESVIEGISIVSINPQKVIFAYGINK